MRGLRNWRLQYDSYSITSYAILVVMSNAAPGDLGLIEELVNTWDLEDDIDTFSSPDALAGWLAEHGLAAPGEPLSHADLASAIAVREALRALLLANNQGELDPGAPATLSAAADRARLTVAVGADGSARVEPRAEGIDRVFGRLLGIVARAQADGSWERMKACPWHTCHVAFYDHSRNRSRTWCSMAVCGNRAKARTYRQR